MKRLALSICVVALFGFAGLSQAAFIDTMCALPPVVGFGTKPNVLIVQDYSGSMQQPAYYSYPLTDWTPGAWGYYSDSKVMYNRVSSAQPYSDPGAQEPKSYYGYFNNDNYYVFNATTNHWEASGTQPTPANFTALSERGTGSSIWFTAPGHGLAVNDLAAFYGLTSHTGMNGNAYYIDEVDGDRIRVREGQVAKWNGTPDRAEGYVVKRVASSLSTGVSGNLLNYITMTRIDASLMAMIGGKADCASGTCTRRPQGSRRWLYDSTHNAVYFIRPGTLGNPNDYRTGTYQKDSSNNDRDVFVSVLPIVTGLITHHDAEGEYSPGSNFGGHRDMEKWQFTLTEARSVVIRVETNFNEVDVCLYSGTSFSSATRLDAVRATSVPQPSGTYVAEIERSLGAGTYTLVIQADLPSAGSYTEEAAYQIMADVELVPDPSLACYDPGDGRYPPGTPCHEGQVTISTLGTQYKGVRATVQVAEDLRKGVVQENFPYVRYGFMYYKGDAESNYGKILVGCHNTDLSKLVNAIQGTGSDGSLDFTKAYPYYGTPTGPAMNEAYKYFTQTSSTVNSGFIGTSKDPYKDLKVGSSPAVYESRECRRSYVLLVSDGEWNTGGDPLDDVAKLRRGASSPYGDIRSDITLQQVVKTFAIFAFSDEVTGDNAMRWLGMFGAFDDKRNCPGATANFWPFPKTSYSFDSKSTTFNVPECSASTYDDCCLEWDSDKDYLPDGYYNVTNGKELATALTKIMDKVMQATSAASAVATTSQRLADGDLVIRGLFEVAGKERLEGVDAPDYLWFGHLEVYWPFKLSDNTIAYDFDLGTEMCYELNSGTRHCFDTAQILNLDPNRATDPNRLIFTMSKPSSSIFGTSDNNRRNFTTSNIGKTDLAVSTNADAEDLVKWVRGDSTTASVLTKYRVRGDGTRGKGWCMGDIVYSTPVVSGPPRLGAVSKKFYGKSATGTCVTFQDYLNWRDTGEFVQGSVTTKVRNRDKVVFVGANDGMLHAFLLSKCVPDSNNECQWVSDPTVDPDIGKELWAYIPTNLLTELQHLAKKTYGTPGGCAHRTMVDLAPQTYEMYFSDGTWRTILMGGERGGGDTYFAIDVTNPRDPKILWEYNVAPDLVLRFDENEALEAFWSACGTLSYHPGWSPPGQCYTPQIPSSWFQGSTYTSRCEGCRPNGSTTDKSSCLALLNHYGGDQWYLPFSLAGTYEATKLHLFAWTKPSVGRLKWPESLSLCTAGPKRGTGGDCLVNCDQSGQSPDAKIAANPYRNVAFMGVGLRPSQQGVLDPWPTDWPQFIKDGFGSDFMRPFVVALDVELGVNLFRYVWGEIHHSTASTFFKKVYGGCGSSDKVCVKGETESGCTTPLSTNCDTEIPYAMSDVAALDLYKGVPNDNTSDPPSSGPVCNALQLAADGFGEDDFVDTLYVGDLNGLFYKLSINFDETINVQAADKNLGLRVDLWYTKPIYTTDEPTNLYRGEKQPIASRPAVSYDLDEGEPAVRVIFGTGKYETVSLDKADKTDTANMSLYNLKDPLSLTNRTISSSEPYSGSLSTDNLFEFQVVPHCCIPGASSSPPTCPTYRCWHPSASGGDSDCPRTVTDSDGVSVNLYGCNWVRSSTGAPDCCQSSCTSPCWTCVFDFTSPELRGERVINKPIIAGELVFVTTVAPVENPCAGGGYGFLYIFDYMCRKFPLGFDPTEKIDETIYSVLRLTSGTGDDARMFGARISLGFGIPSQPVLDSTGDNLLIQKSDGTLMRLQPNLLSKRTSVKGWVEEAGEGAASP